jgi:predicted nucleic-acid-binding Zn-ribbon protein
MGLFDYFKSKSLQCPKCGSFDIDFQGRPRGSCLFVWEEGFTNPVDQLVDEECKIANNLNRQLNENEWLYGNCKNCNYEINAIAVIENNIWTKTNLSNQSLKGRM